MVYPGLFNASYVPAPLELAFINNPAGYLSPYLFAVILSFLVAGLVLGQAARYCSKFRAMDPIGLQLHVLLVLVLTALKLLQLGAVAYLDFAENYGNYLFLTHKNWTLRISVLTATIVSATVQVFFIRRCFLLSHNSLLFLVPTGLAWLASIGSAIWVTIVFPVDWATRSYMFVQAGRVAPGTTLACDLLITGFTVWYLMQSRNAFPAGTESPVARLLRITFESATPPLLTALFNVVYDDQKAGGYVFLFVALTPLLETMSMLYSLNSRLYFRKGDRRSMKSDGQHVLAERSSPRTLSGPLGSPFPLSASFPFEKLPDAESPRSGGSTDTFVGASPRSPRAFRPTDAWRAAAPEFEFRGAAGAFRAPAPDAFV